MEEEFKNLSKKERRALKKRLKQKKREQTRCKQRITKILLMISATIIVAGGLWLFINRNSRSPAEVSTGVEPLEITSNDWVRGLNISTSSATLIEYSDFQCPACASYFPITKRLQAEFTDSLRLVYRHFPLTQIHPNAELAAWAAEAAGKQGKFWQMHDFIFEHQEDWSKKRNPREIFISYANELGIENVQFINDLDSQEVKEKVKKDYQSGLQLGVDSTPTFFLNGKMLDNPKSFEEFKEIINKELSGDNS